MLKRLKKKIHILQNIYLKNKYFFPKKSYNQCFTGFIEPEIKEWNNKKFINTHPSGSLATALIQVKEIMATGKDIPLILANRSIKNALTEMNKKNLGVVCIKEKKGKINLITDGDVRRNSNNLYKKKITQIF